MRARKPSVAIAVFVGVATLTAACGFVIDPDLLVAGNVDDADVPTKGECTPTSAEVCDDGIDNDCNGRVDCEDSACTEGFACMEPPPDEWAPILLASDVRPKCPAGYTGSTDVRVLQGNGAITCACECGNNCDATITLTKSTEQTCKVAPTTDTFQADAAKCTSKSLDLPSGFAMATSGSGTCAANDTMTKSNPTDGRTCAPPQAAGAGCQGAQRCLPKATGFATCIAKAGTNACPATVFTKQWRSGMTASDSRACTGCSCNSNPCRVELELWSHPVCQGTPDIKITSSCAANGTTNSLKAYRSKTTGGCTQATPSTPQGAISFQNEQTICCQ